MLFYRSRQYFSQQIDVNNHSYLLIKELEISVRAQSETYNVPHNMYLISQ